MRVLCRFRLSVGAIALVLLTLITALVAAPAFAEREYKSQLTGTPTGADGGEVAFKEPQGVAVDGSGDLWVSDGKRSGAVEGEAKIDEFGPSGEFLAQGSGRKLTAQEKKEKKEKKEVGTIVCKDGVSNEKVKEWTAEFWKGTADASIAFSDISDALYLADSSEEQLWEMNEDACVFGEIFPTPISFSQHSDGSHNNIVRVAADDSSMGTRGDVYITGSGAVFRIEGGVVGSSVPAPFEGSAAYISGDEITGDPTGVGEAVRPFAQNIYSIAVDPANGDLYVPTSFENAQNRLIEERIDEFEPSGVFVRQIDPETGGHRLTTVSALAVDPVTGDVLVSGQESCNSEDNCPNAIYGFNSSGVFLEKITEAEGVSFGLSSGNGATSLIRGLAVNSLGDLYVSDSYNKAVYEFGPFRSPSSKHLLSVQDSGSGSGVVTSVPMGIDCGLVCSAEYAQDTVVTLTASAAEHFRFKEWSGACSGTGVCEVSMSEDKSVGAVFESEPLFGLEVLEPGSGAGVVSSSPVGVDCPGVCTGEFDAGRVVVLSARAAVGSVFMGWSGGGCAGTGTCEVAMTEAESVSATFEPVLDTVGVVVTGGGSVRAHSGVILGCTSGGGGVCSGAYEEGSMVALSARPGPHEAFVGWSGGGCSGTGGCVVSVVGDMSVVAVFAPVLDTLEVVVGGGGVVSSAPGGVDCGSVCSAMFEEDKTVVLTATPAAGFTFVGWSGCDAEPAGACEVSMGTARTVTATFVAVPVAGKPVVLVSVPLVGAPLVFSSSAPPVLRKVVMPKSKSAAQIRSERLARALKGCRTKPRSKRKGCEAAARRRYGAKPKAKARKSSGRSGS